MDVQVVAGVPNRYRGRTLSRLADQAATLLEAPLAARYREMCVALSEWPKAGVWALVFSGPAGTSKSSLAAAALSVYGGQRAGWFSAVELARQAREGQGDLSFLQGVWPVVIDDLGSEYATYFSNALFDGVVAACYDNEMPLVLTTNLTREQLSSAYTARMADRLSEATLWVDTSGFPSFRGLI